MSQEALPPTGLVPSLQLIQIIQEIIQKNEPYSSSSSSSSMSNHNITPLYSCEELAYLKQNLDDNYVTSRSLKLILKYLKVEDKKDQSLLELIKGSSLKFPQFKKPVIEV